MQNQLALAPKCPVSFTLVIDIVFHTKTFVIFVRKGCFVPKKFGQAGSMILHGGCFIINTWKNPAAGRCRKYEKKKRGFIMARVYNFSAGPSMLPEKVLKQAQAELMEYGTSGQSIM